MGRKGREKICPKTHLTMYVQVSVCDSFFCDLALFRFLSLLSFPPFLGLFFYFIGSMCDGLFYYYLIIFFAFIGWALGYDAGSKGR